MEFFVATASELYRLSANVQLIGEDLLVAVWGGEQPHIGAVAVAQPRPSLSPSNDQASATASVICLLGHKEDAIAKSAAETLAAAMNRPVVVSAGMHWAQIDAEGIRKVEENANQLVSIILHELVDRQVISGLQGGG